MKNPAEMSAAAINHELEALDKKDSALTREMIDAGYGHVRFSDTEKLAPEFWPRTKAISDRKRALRIEVEMRAGPGMYRLPRGFGPRKQNPMKRKPKVYRLAWTTFHEGSQYMDGTIERLRSRLARLVADGTAFRLTDEHGKVTRFNANRQANPLKFDRCVRAVKRRGGRVNPYAVCTAAGTRRRK